MLTRIAVLSDTHDLLPEHVIGEISQADQIWHLGDVGDDAIIDRLRDLDRPVRVVRGNCDTNTDWPLEDRFTLRDRRFLLIHVPPRFAPSGVDILIHGHTHVPRDEMVLGTRFLNPGTVGKPNKGVPASYGWLTFGDTGSLTWETVCV